MQRRRTRDGNADGSDGAVQPSLDSRGDDVQYRAKATTSLRAVARVDPPHFAAVTEGTDLVVAVNVYDRAGSEVVHTDITTWVTPVD